MSAFYDAQGLLSTLDMNGEKPELYIVCSRVRGPGKTFSLTRHLMQTYLDTGGKFVLIARTRAETGNVADGMMKSMLDTLHPGMSVTEKIRMGGAYSDVYLRQLDGEEDENGNPSFTQEHCGYVIALNAADAIKKVSSKFTDSVHAFFDEFQPDNMETYLSNEVGKFLTVHGSIARGEGQSRRYYPVYMSSNTINIANPYFVELGLTNKIQPDTKKYRGDGVVFQRATNEPLVDKHANTPMSRAFSGNKTISYSDNSWMNDNNAGVGKPKDWGRSAYSCTLDRGGQRFGLFFYPEAGLLYLGHNYDKECPIVYRVMIDGESNMPLIKSSETGVMIRKAITRGAMRFQDQVCKQFAMEFLV